MEIDEGIIHMISEKSCVTVSNDRNVNLYTDLYFDSLSFIELLLSIEDTYGISFDITEMDGCLQINNLIALVVQKVKERDSLD